VEILASEEKKKWGGDKRVDKRKINQSSFKWRCQTVGVDWFYWEDYLVAKYPLGHHRCAGCSPGLITPPEMLCWSYCGALPMLGLIVAKFLRVGLARG
jgi:hypothetical protein